MHARPEGRSAAEAEPSGADDGLCEQRLSGTVALPFLQVQLADGVLVVQEEIGWAATATAPPALWCLVCDPPGISGASLQQL